MEKNQFNASLITFVSVLFGFILMASYMIGPYILAMIMGGILALLARPAFRWLRKRRFKSHLAAFLVTVGVVILVIGPTLIFATMAVKQGITIANFVSETQDLSLDHLIDLFLSWRPIAQVFDATEIESQLERWLQGLGKGASAVILSIAKSIPEGGLQMILICLTCYFMLVDGVRFLNWVYARIPLSADVRLRLVEAFHTTAISVIWASMAAAFTQAAIIFLAFFILKVPAAFLAGGLTFILAFIPFAGSVPVWVAGAIFLFVQGSYVKGLVMIGFGILTSSIDNFVRPWILKGRSEMHPLVSLVAIVGGIHLFGLFGVFLGPIIAAVVISLLQIWPVIGQRYGLEFDTGFEVQDEFEPISRPRPRS